MSNTILDVCPRCKGSFLKTGGFPIDCKEGDKNYHCQACSELDYFTGLKEEVVSNFLERSEETS